MLNNTDTHDVTTGQNPTHQSGVERSLKKKNDTVAEAKQGTGSLAEKSSIADGLDLEVYREMAAEVADTAVDDMLQRAAAAEDFSDVAAKDTSSKNARAKAYANVLPIVQELSHNPEIVWAIAERNAIQLTGRTVKSFTLAAIKVLYPGLDRRDQSTMAQIHNHALACEWSSADLEREIKKVGAVELIKRERKRQRLLAGEADAPAMDNTLTQYSSEQTGFPVSQICTPGEIPEGGFGLLIGGVVNGELLIFDVDDSEKRVLAAMKHSLKRGCLLKTRPADADAKQDEK